MYTYVYEYSLHATTDPARPVTWIFHW